MSSEFGTLIKISVFGQSHGKAIGVVIDGLPAGETVDTEELQAFLNRRRGGGSPLSTARKEGDVPVFLSGLENGRTCGAPLCAVIENADQHSSDYAGLTDTPRPGHADFTAAVKWGGAADMRGGGHFSGRLTAPLCIAGGIAKQILSRRGIHVGAHLSSVGTEQDDVFPLHPTADLFDTVAAKAFPVLSDEAGARMQEAILAARSEGDSLGGILGGITTGMPLTLRAAFKPTPSIAKPQQTVSLSAMENTQLQIRGRHDPCIAHRAVPVVEAVTAAVLLDLLLEGNHGTF